MDGVKWLNPDTTITQSLCVYGERGFSHGVEDGNDFTDCVVSRRDCYLLVIGVCDHIGRRIHVVEHDLIGCEQDNDGSDGWVPILVGVNLGERAVTGWALDEHGVVHFPLITKRHSSRKTRRRFQAEENISHIILVKTKNYKSFMASHGQRWKSGSEGDHDRK